MSLWSRKFEMPSAESALPGRDAAMPVPPLHEVLGQPLTSPFPSDSENIVVGMGCFWGAERIFWETDGVLTNVALCWERGAFFGGVNYMRVFAIETGTNQLDRGVPVDLPEEDFDLLEIVAGYRLNERMAILLSYETQVGGDTQVEKEKQITLELRYKL